MQTELSQYTAVIGIDWADKKHDVCVQDMATGKRRASQVRHRAEDLDEWARSLHRRFGGPIAIAVELSKGPIINVLQKYDFFVIYPIDPSKLANHRKTFTTSGAKDDPTDATSGAKDDPTDAEFALDLLSKHTEHFKPLNPQSVGMRTLKPLEWFDHIDTVLFCDFIRRWPSLPQARRARRATIERFFREHNMNRKPLLERRIKAIKSAMPLTTDDAVVVPHRLPQHPDYELFSPLPGAGPVHTPRLMVAFGEQRERFNNAAEVQKYGGLAPVTKRSGQSTWVHWRWQCPTFLRQTFVEWAAQTINKSYWAGLYYQQQRSRGCSHQAAVRALAFKWIRILYRCWKTRTPYDETRYLKALQKRGSPLLKTAEAA